MTTSVVVISKGDAEIAFSDHNIVIIDLDKHNVYLYKELVCKVVSVNDDGTVDLACIDAGDGKFRNHRFINIPADSIEPYWDSDMDILDDDDLYEGDDD